MKIKFYIGYFYRKLIANFFEIKTPRLRLYLVNILYMLSKINKNINWQNFANIEFIETKFGKFKVRPKTFDVICASPDFERPDIDLVVKTLDKIFIKNKTVKFLDIGADIGTYSIILGNKFYKKKIAIYAFEPFKESYDLCKENIFINSLQDKVKVFNYGLYNKKEKILLSLNSDNPGGQSIIEKSYYSKNTYSIKVNVLDDMRLIEDVSENTVLFIKMDIEGAEKYALEGSKKTIDAFSEVYILAEDFIDESIIDYLNSNNFIRISKKTPYNSIWYRIK